MRYIILILLILSVYTLSAQSYYPETANNKITINYPDHALSISLKPVKERIFLIPDKYYYWYSANDIKVTQGGFSGKLLNGPYSDFYKNKNLKEQGFFSNGLKSGKWSSWQDNGKLREIKSWYKGEMRGSFSKYDAEGNVEEKGRYKKGLITGTLKNHIGTDSVNVVYYKAGKPAVKKSMMPGFLKKLFKKKIK